MLPSKPDIKKTTFLLLIALIKMLTSRKEKEKFYVDHIILYVHQTTGKTGDFMKILINELWNIAGKFSFAAIKQKKKDVEWNFKTIFTRWKKHVDDMFPSHVMKFLSSDDVEKLVFVFWLKGKDFHQLNLWGRIAGVKCCHRWNIQM